MPKKPKVPLKSAVDVIRQDQALAILADHLESLALLARTHGLNYIAEQIERVG